MEDDTVNATGDIVLHCLLPAMEHTVSEAPRRFKHIFLDAEGTLYVPKNGESWWDFWTDPSPERALGFFELDQGVAQALRVIRQDAETLCIVSFNRAPILEALLSRFGIAEMFDSTLLNGDKGRLIERYLRKNGLKKEDAVMVGDMPDLDILPVKKVGVEAILVDRPYNRWARAERIAGIGELPVWLRVAGIAEPGFGKRFRASILDDFLSPGLVQVGTGQIEHKTKRLIAEAGESGHHKGFTGRAIT